MNYFELIAVISLFCLGLRAITDDGMIGYPIRVYFLKNLPSAGKPVILCSTCMSSVWGTIIYWSALSTTEPLSLIDIPIWIGVCVSAAFVNSVLWEYYQSINTCKSN
jgi:hypothetical protein